MENIQIFILIGLHLLELSAYLLIAYIAIALVSWPIRRFVLGTKRFLRAGFVR